MKLIIVISCFLFSFIGFSQAELIKDIYPGMNDGTSWTREIIEYNNKFYFGANDGIHGIELWEYDIDTAIMVADIFPSSIYSSSHPSSFIEFDSKLYFTANDSIHGTEIWSFDGVNTSLVFDLFPGTESSVNYWIQFQILNNELYFIGTNSIQSGFWKMDQNENFTFILNPSNSVDIRRCVGKFNSDILFIKNTASINNSSFNLYKFDGQVETLIPGYIWHDTIGGFYMGVLQGNALETIMFQGSLYLRGFDYTHGYELWKYDGNSVSLAFDINPGFNIGFSHSSFAVFNNDLYIVGQNGTSYLNMLYKFDGTNLTLIEPLGFSTFFNGFQVNILENFDDKLFFSKDNYWNGVELWTYNGISSSLFQEFRPGTDSTLFYMAKQVGPYLFLELDDHFNGFEYWRLEACNIQTTSQNYITACNSYISPSGMLIDSSGTYHDTILNVCGQDSIMTIYVTVNYIDVSTTELNYTISSNQTNANYQWLNCEDNSEILGAVNQLYAPYVNGIYAVIVTNNETGCSDTSDCVTISGLSISNTNGLNISIYPNPSNGNLYIKGLESDQNPIVQIYNSLGQAIPFTLDFNGGLTSIQTQSKGVLFIHIKTDNGTVDRRVVVE